VQYLNIREYDLEDTNLLRYWDKTFTFIQAQSPPPFIIWENIRTYRENQDVSLRKYHDVA
jgi:hypothetical protein